jgi:hypothetical protein
VKIFAAERIFEQPLLLFMEPDRSITIIITTSRREAFPVALNVVDAMLKNLMNQVGTAVEQSR